jgi:hypothetical protein
MHTRQTVRDPLKWPRAVLSMVLGAMAGFFAAVYSDAAHALLGHGPYAAYTETAESIVISLAALIGLILGLRTPRGLRPGDRLG